MKRSMKRIQGFRRAVMLFGIAAALGAVVAAPARADDDDWHHKKHKHGHHERDWRGYYSPGYYVAPGYVYTPPPVVYVPPPPVVYAPPPVVYAPPPAGINLLFHFH